MSLTTLDEKRSLVTARFSLRLFGHAELHGPAGSISLSPLQWALVAVLFAHEDDGLARARILPLLWKRGSGAVLLRRLSQLVYSLDQKAGESLLLRAGNSLRPNRAVVDADLDRYLAAVSEEDFGAASQTLASGFLRGLPDVPTREFEEWIDRRSASLRAGLRSAAARRWARAEQEGLWTRKTLEAACALHEISPGDEGALRRAMWAQALVGTPLEAMATFDSFVERNAIDGDDDVESETRTLLERVRSLSKQPRGGSSENRTPSRSDPTLFGRDAELARLRPILSGPVESGLRVVRVRGAAGLGKSRLIQECLGPAALQGRLVLRAQLAELERDIPLNALIEAFSTQEVARALEPLDEPWRSLLLHLMPGFTAVVGAALPIPPVQPESLQRRLLEAVRLLVERVVLDRPVVLFLDDFQWVDDSSLAALEYLRRRWSTGSAVLVVNVRPESMRPDSGLESFLDAAGVVRVDLDELDDVSQKQLVREVADGEISGEVLARIQALAGGNPLYLIELTRQWLDGQLALPSRSDDEIQLPVSIQQLYEHRFRGLGGHARRILEALAVWGKPISVGDATSVAGLHLADATEGLEELDGLGLLRWHQDGVELMHGLLRQAVFGRIGEGRRRWLHLQAAELLHQLPAPEAGELALHSDRALRREDALKHSLVAADHAETVGAIDEALRFLGIAARNADGQSKCVIQHRLADVLYLRCMYEEALALYANIVTTAGQNLTPEQHWRARVRMLDCQAHTNRVRFDEFIARNARLRREAASSGRFEIVTMGLASAVHHMQRTNRTEGAAHLFAEVHLCAKQGSPRARCHGNQLAAGLALMTGEGGGFARIARQVAEEHGLHDLVPSVAAAEIAAWVLSGRLATEDGHILQRKAIEVAERAGDRINHVRILNNIAAFHLDTGEPDLAETFLERVQQLSGTSLAIPEDFHILMNLGELALARGDLASARRRFLQCIPARPDRAWHGWGIAHAGLGLCALEFGRLREAAKQEELMVSGLPPLSPFPVDQCICALFAARLSARRQDLAGALRTLETSERRFSGIHVPHFLRIRALRVRFARRAGHASVESLAQAGYDLAAELQLRSRAASFAPFLA